MRSMWKTDSQFGASMRQMDLSDSVQHASRWKKWHSGEDVLSQTQSSGRKECQSDPSRWETESHAAFTYYVRPQELGESELDTSSGALNRTEAFQSTSRHNTSGYNPNQYQDCATKRESSAQSHQPQLQRTENDACQEEIDQPGHYECVEVPVNFSETEYAGRPQDHAGNIVDEELKTLHGEEMERQRLEKQRQEELEQKERKKREEQERIRAEKEAKREAKRKRLERKKKQDQKPLTPAEMTARAKKQEQLDRIQNSRELSNSGFSKHFKKPPFHSYGHGNVRPIKGGVMHGNYMTSYNVQPLLSRASQKYEDIMDDVAFVYDSALLHLDPSKTGQESSGEEPDEHHETLLDTAREKLKEEYGENVKAKTNKRAENRQRRSSITDQMEGSKTSQQPQQGKQEKDGQNPTSSGINAPKREQSNHHPQTPQRQRDQSQRTAAPRTRQGNSANRGATSNPKNAEGTRQGVNFEKKLGKSKKGSARRKLAMECHPSSWETESHAATRRTGVKGPDTSPQKKQELQEKLEADTSEIFKIPMRYRRSWSAGVSQSLQWVDDEPATKPAEPMAQSTQGNHQGDNSDDPQQHNDTQVMRSTDRSNNRNVSQVDVQEEEPGEVGQGQYATQGYYHGVPPPPPPQATHSIVGEEATGEPTVRLVTSEFRPRSVRERDPRQFKYLPVEWSKAIRPAGRAVPKSDTVGHILHPCDC
eukprot:gb/GECG01007687.1/.p1 GENE.gb/GECG01007687.1/~~gb/GECG01007687.1/.p1  ORF type:complete len:705 (+),score=123.60 gb/GECG01007687.1/:1-2115(+)